MTARTSIAYLTFSVDGRNGLGRFSREVVRRVAARGHQVLVLTYHKDVVDDEIAGTPGVEVRACLPSHYDLASLWRNIRWGKRVSREIRGCDLIHALFDFPHTELALRAARRLGVPYIASAVGTYSIAPLYERRHAGRLALAFLQAHKVIAISKYTLREIEKRVHIPGAVVIPLGVDAHGLAPDPSLGAQPTDRFQIVGVGALKGRKGWDVLIDAVAELKDLSPPVHAAIVGGMEVGDAAAQLRQRASEKGVADRIEFPGVMDDAGLAAQYSRSHLYVMPSRSDRHKVEGFGLVYLEAGAFALPQIGCRDTGAEEPIVDGQTGLLVPQNDPSSLARAIRRLHDEPELRVSMAVAARKRAVEMSWDVTVQGILDTYPLRQRRENDRFDSAVMSVDLP